MKNNQKVDGNRLKNIINERGYKSITAFSHACGISRTVISSLCNDSYMSDLADGTLALIASTLNVSPKYLTGESNFRSLEEQIDVLSADFKTSKRIEGAIKQFLTDSGTIEDIDGLHRLHGRTQYDYVDMTDAEQKRLLSFLRKRIVSACNDYIDSCAVHDLGKCQK